MSILLGTQSRAAIGATGFGWGPGHVDFTETSRIPPPGDDGRSIDLSRAETSLQKIAVWSCVTLTATIAEILPLDGYSGDGQDKRPRKLPGWMEDLGGTGHGTPDWCWMWVYSQMLRGNAYAPVVERDRTSGKPRVVPLAHPDDVAVRRDSEGRLEWRVCGTTYYDDEVWHRRSYPIPGYFKGLSPIAQHALTIGTGLRAMKFGHDWFVDGAHPSAILTTDQEIGEKSGKEAKARFVEAVRGRREPAVLGNGWKYQPIQIAPNESQFLETNQYTSGECCRIFGPAYAEIFGYETGGSLTYSNIEQRSLDLLTYAVDPWLVRLERVLSWLLPAPQYVKFNRDALVRTDLLTRYRAHEIALRNRWRTVNGVLALEDEPPVPWGNEPNAAAPAAPPVPVQIES